MDKISEVYDGEIEELWQINSKEHYDIKYDTKKIIEIVTISDPDTKDRHGRYFIHYAAEYGMNVILLYLIELGAGVNVELNNDGFTPLSFAIVNGRYETAQILVSNGARLSNREEDIVTLLMDDTIEKFTDILLDQKMKKDFISFLLDLENYLTSDEEKSLRKYRLKLLF